MISAAEWADLLERVRWKRPKSRIRGRSYRRTLEIESTDGNPARLELSSWDMEEDSTFPSIRVSCRTRLQGDLRIGNVLHFPVLGKKWFRVPGLDSTLEGLCTHPRSASELLNAPVTKLLKSWFSQDAPPPGVLIHGDCVVVCDSRHPMGVARLIGLVERGFALAKLVFAGRSL